MKLHRPFLQATAIVIIGIFGIVPSAIAQQLEREGKLQRDMVNVMLDESDAILSFGPLNSLDADPNFTGDLDDLMDESETLLDDYSSVQRGGHFPENEGIPLSQQLTVDECVYRLFQLENGNELMIYQSHGKSIQYLIRGAN